MRGARTQSRQPVKHQFPGVFGSRLPAEEIQNTVEHTMGDYSGVTWKENGKLKKEIEQKGLVISEYPPDAEPQRYFFPQRNRIISGLSELTLIVQARNDSGALITAELAAEQGREVCALPGNIDSQYNIGSNKLIREGATPVLSTGDLLEMLGAGAFGREEAERILSETELRIYRLLCEHGELSTDELCRIMEKPPSYVAGIVTVMEMKGAVFSDMGKVFIAKA